METKAILVGSNAFFKDIEGFNGKDKDYLIFVDEPTDFKVRKEVRLRSVDRFYYRRMPATELIERTIAIGDPMLVGKFLLPEVAEEIGLTVKDILALRPLLDKLDDKHKYQTDIFNAIVENGSFTLTEEQTRKAYETYCLYRKERYQH